MFPIPRIGTRTTGDGATTAAEGPVTPCRPEIASTLGGGATAEASGRLSRRDVVWATEGGGATTELIAEAADRCKLLMLEPCNPAGARTGATSGRPGPAILILCGFVAAVRPRLVETIR